ncbi:aminoglycoside phosphotransferase family protein [candidate division KSB1 bacterium]|nr:aminoglycoside phosphotransferase family protein [candidate division KSB1 bacterium]NIR69704.1 aminoglycoside phosphotransferase family protein [candidate division KSB1 bacterium]NIS24900.1 aminoglycoside phosphotransferase family protein [candidate division KSB1 bacterium]NIT69749.1 aminoglycoside phosphotransferase family protein [candidate division KSB1 bacterium]NIU23419.1 aminoglycoside phosphotransferase family protein [candidate division KSB1 bacterium]
MVLDYLKQNWQHLELQRFGEPASLSFVMATPRFRASSHLIFFILSKSRSKPILVVKVPRIQGDNSRLDREASNLRFVHSARPGGFATIPNVVAYEDYLSNRLLIETAMTCDTMRRAIVRRQPEVCIDAVLDWLLELQQATKRRDRDHWFEDLVKQPLNDFQTVFPSTADEDYLFEQTRKIADGLLNKDLPFVCEHGDLSSPNILMGEKNEIAVVDWELAEPQGLPAVDLFFFLTYVAFARRGARKSDQCVAAFHDAFFGKNSWTVPHIRRYSETLGVQPGALKPLFVLCWARYVAGLVRRLTSMTSDYETLSEKEAVWLRENRYYALWLHTIEHFDELSLCDMPGDSSKQVI